MKKDRPRANVRQYAMDLLLISDRTEKGLYDRLLKKGYTAEEAADALSYVKSFGYVDDRRFACNYVRNFGETRSRKRITFDLRQKGVPEDLIREALETEETGDPVRMITALLVKKHYDPSDEDPKARQRIVRFLASRGFGWNEISEALEQYDGREDDC